MKKKRIIIVGLISIFVVLFIALAFQRLKPDKSPEKEKVAERQAPKKEYLSEERIELPKVALQTLPLKTSIVERQTPEREIQTTAVIELNETLTAHVSPRILGRVVEVKALLGDIVEKGQILAELNSIELGQAKAEYLKAKASLEVARANYEREDRLFKQKISSEKEYLNARGEFLSSQAQFKSAREALRLLGLSDNEIDTLTWGGKGHPPSHFPLLAPFAGTVVEKHITLGELIKPEDNPYTIADLSNLWIQLAIYEKDLRWINIGTKVRLKVDAYPGEYFQGVVTYVSDILDESTRTAKARIEIHNPDRKLKPGMFATASIFIPAPSAKEVIAIPKSAVYKVREKPVAFVQEGEGIFAMRELKLGQDSGSYVEVLNGLKKGEKIVTEGGFDLKSIFLKEEFGEE